MTFTRKTRVFQNWTYLFSCIVFVLSTVHNIIHSHVFQCARKSSYLFSLGCRQWEFRGHRCCKKECVLPDGHRPTGSPAHQRSLGRSGHLADGEEKNDWRKGRSTKGGTSSARVADEAKSRHHEEGGCGCGLRAMPWPRPLCEETGDCVVDDAYCGEEGLLHAT